MTACRSDVAAQDLQTLLSLITNFPAVRGRLLANVRTFVVRPPSLVLFPEGC